MNDTSESGISCSAPTQLPLCENHAFTTLHKTLQTQVPMSLEIDWNRLLEDEANISEHIREFLDKKFKELPLPPYIKALSVSSFSLGTVAPEVTIKHISDPFPEFYEEEDDNDDSDERADQAPQELFDPNEQATYSRTPSPDPPNVEYTRRDSESMSLPSYTTEPPEQEEPVTEQEHTSPPLTPNGGLHYFHPLPSNLFAIRSPLYASLQNLHGFQANNTTATATATPADPLPLPRTRPHPHQRPQEESPRDYEQRTSKPHGREDDTQFFLEVAYSGDMKVGVSATLLLNYPSPSFVTLPLKLTLTGLEIRAMAVLTYISRRIHFSFICDVDKEGDAVTQLGQDRIDIIKDVKIESEIGDQEGNGPVLRNVGKIERFLLERLRVVARDELAWPGWLTFEF